MARALYRQISDIRHLRLLIFAGHTFRFRVVNIASGNRLTFRARLVGASILVFDASAEGHGRRRFLVHDVARLVARNGARWPLGTLLSNSQTTDVMTLELRQDGKELARALACRILPRLLSAEHVPKGVRLFIRDPEKERRDSP